MKRDSLLQEIEGEMDRGVMSENDNDGKRYVCMAGNMCIELALDGKNCILGLGGGRRYLLGTEQGKSGQSKSIESRKDEIESSVSTL